jgi:NTE family protein
LVLQGGGGLGAYQIGAYEALHEAGLEPDWIAGTSIGAINAAVLAGNPPADRLARLEALWREISRPDGWGSGLSGEWLRLSHTESFWEALVLGQPHFFTPRLPGPFLSPPGSAAATSFYDTAPLLDTLGRLVDFAMVNRGSARLTLAATNVETGDLVFFDSSKITLGREHVLASGSLPPAFPPVRIGDALYWDGACVSNTPLDAVLMDEPPGPTLVFLIDLWSASGAAPASIADVLWRQKQIQYASRIAHGIESVAAKIALRRAQGDGPAGAAIEIVHIIYHPTAEEIPNSDAEFSRPSIAARRAAGLSDMRLALAHSGLGAATGVAVHKVARGAVQTRTQFRDVRPGVGWAPDPR